MNTFISENLFPSFHKMIYVFLQAIVGFGALRYGLWSQQLVPLNEMVDVLKVVKDIVQVKPKSWVRIKRGVYKDDIAQVFHSFSSLKI